MAITTKKETFEQDLFVGQPIFKQINLQSNPIYEIIYRSEYVTPSNWWVNNNTKLNQKNMNYLTDGVLQILQLILGTNNNGLYQFIVDLGKFIYGNSTVENSGIFPKLEQLGNLIIGSKFKTENYDYYIDYAGFQYPDANGVEKHSRELAGKDGQINKNAESIVAIQDIYQFVDKNANHKDRILYKDSGVEILSTSSYTVETGVTTLSTSFNSSLLPSVTKNQYLGASNRHWKKAFIDAVDSVDIFADYAHLTKIGPRGIGKDAFLIEDNSENIEVFRNFLPVDESLSIGSKEKPWYDTHTKNLHVDLITPNHDIIVFTDHNDDSFDILNETEDLDTLNHIKLGITTEAIYSTVSIVPIKIRYEMPDKEFNLGHTENYWTNVYAQNLFIKSVENSLGDGITFKSSIFVDNNDATIGNSNSAWKQGYFKSVKIVDPQEGKVEDDSAVRWDTLKRKFTENLETKTVTTIAEPFTYLSQTPKSITFEDESRVYEVRFEMNQSSTVQIIRSKPCKFQANLHLDTGFTFNIFKNIEEELESCTIDLSTIPTFDYSEVVIKNYSTVIKIDIYLVNASHGKDNKYTSWIK